MDYKISRMGHKWRTNRAKLAQNGFTVSPRQVLICSLQVHQIKTSQVTVLANWCCRARLCIECWPTHLCVNGSSTAAAAMELAASITSALAIQSIVFLTVTDNQQLVTFFNGTDHSTPPCWDIKPYTQRFINNTCNRNSRVFKVARSLNTTFSLMASKVKGWKEDGKIMSTYRDAWFACLEQ